MPAGSVMSWRQSKVTTRSADPSVGIGSCRGSAKDALVTPASACRSAPGEGVLRDVVAGDPAGGEGRPRADGRPRRRRSRRRATGCTVAELGVDAVERRAAPWAGGGRASTARSRGRRPRRSRGRGRRSPARARCGSSRGGARAAAMVWGRWWKLPMPKAGCSSSASTATASGARRQPLVVVDLDDLGRPLVVGPLPHPALVQPQPIGQLGRWSAASRRPASAR